MEFEGIEARAVPLTSQYRFAGLDPMASFWGELPEL